MKNCYSLIMLIGAMLITSCSKSPEEIIEKIYSSADKGDYSEILSYVVPDSIKDFNSADRKKFDEYMAQQLGETPLYSSYKIDSILPEDNGNKFKFFVKTNLTDGVAYNEDGFLEKSDNGGWKLKLQKSDNDNSYAFSIENKTKSSKELMRAIKYAYDMTMALKGYPQHMLRASFYYYNGILIPEDKDQYFILASSAAKRNYAPAVYETGLAYYEGNGVGRDDKKAFEYWQKAADMGYGDAFYSIGDAYERGIGVAQDYNKAREWYEKSIELDQNIDSYYRLGYIYLEGLGVQKNIKKGVELLEKAVDNGSYVAKAFLGGHYILGDIVSRDSSKGIALLEDAAENGMILACQVLGMAYYYDMPDIKKDYAKAFYYYKKGADLPISKSNYAIERDSKKECIRMVADFYKKGIGTMENPNKYEEYSKMKVE